MSEPKEKILDVMKKAGKPLKAGEIADMAGMDKNVVDKVMNELKKDNAIISPKRCYWQPR